jgi:hypothetical protein
MLRLTVGLAEKRYEPLRVAAEEMSLRVLLELASTTEA